MKRGVFGDSRSFFRGLAVSALALGAWTHGLAAYGAEIVVTSNAGSGPGSLDAAIAQTMNATEPTTITFDLAGETTIRPTTRLATVFSNHPVVIDGGGVVTLDGVNAPNTASGLSAGSDNVTFRGLTIVRFAVGISISGSDCVVESCRIGTDGVSTGAENVLGNEEGIFVIPSAQYTRIGGVGAGNVISGNTNLGLFFDEVFDIRIEGNIIGLNAAGTAGIPNTGFGIRGLNSTLVRIGGSAPGAGNIIAGNGNTAVAVIGLSDAIIEGNVIGLNSARDAVIANSGGIFYGLGSGLGSAIRGNIVCGSGINIRSTSGLAVEGNFFGVNGPEGVPFNASGTGIIVDAVGGASSGIVIGGEGRENVIANYSIRGISLFSANVSRVQISRNAIFNNTQGGIQLTDGANNGMPAPVLTGTDPVAGTSEANARLEFFADDGDQGRFYLGSVLADGAGAFSTGALDLELHAGRNLTATATDLDGNTSTFSLPLAIVGDSAIHSADQNGDGVVSLSELLRVIQFFNSGGYHCVVAPQTSEDGYLPGANADARACLPHASDYNPQDWAISLSELLRLIQFFNSGGYFPCDAGEDGYCPGSA